MATSPKPLLVHPGLGRPDIYVSARGDPSCHVEMTNTVTWGPDLGCDQWALLSQPAKETTKR